MNTEPKKVQVGEEPALIEILLRIWSIIISNWMFFFIASLLFGMITVAGSFLIQKRFQATATVLPIASSSSKSGIVQVLSQINMLQGINLEGGGQNYIQLYPVIALSRNTLATILPVDTTESNMLYRLNPDVGEGVNPAHLQNRTILFLQRSLIANVDRFLGCMSLSFEHEDPVLAADVVNAVIKEMDSYFLNKIFKDAKNNSRMIAERIATISDSLKMAEMDLKQFKEQNRDYSHSPALQLEFSRLFRSVELYNAIFIELSKQLELSKINENAEGTSINVLDWATVPWKKSYPSRIRFGMVGVLFGNFLVFILLVLHFTDRSYWFVKPFSKYIRNNR